MTRRYNVWLGVVVGLWLPLSMAPRAGAEVSPGDVIDKTNWQEVQDLLPQAVLDWVKKGEFVLNVGALDYDPADYWTEAVLRSRETNKGRYALDEAGVIVDAATGKTPTFIAGEPFPGVDLEDPQAAQKIMHNRLFYGYTLGNIDYPFVAAWVGTGGYEREVWAGFLQYPMVGNPAAAKEKNPKGIERYSIVRVLSPYDIAGTNVLTWRYLDHRQDMTYGYIPAIRRVRRMSPANRSDAFIGTDMCVDDAYGFDGKIASVEWRVVETTEALFPFLSEAAQALVQNKKGEWMTTRSIKPTVYGFEQKGWQGAPWAPTNLVWVKRKAIVLEIQPKDPYYNYGKQQLWLDRDVPFMCFYKIIHDRAGIYWKTIMLFLNAFESADKEMKFLQGPGYLAIDDRVHHATILRALTPETMGRWFAVQDPNIYSLAGFQRLCK